MPGRNVDSTTSGKAIATAADRDSMTEPSAPPSTTSCEGRASSGGSPAIAEPAIEAPLSPAAVPIAMLGCNLSVAATEKKRASVNSCEMEMIAAQRQSDAHSCTPSRCAHGNQVGCKLRFRFANFVSVLPTSLPFPSTQENPTTRTIICDPGTHLMVLKLTGTKKNDSMCDPTRIPLSPCELLRRHHWRRWGQR